MNKTDTSLGKFELIKSHIEGTKADGTAYAFDKFSIMVAGKEISIQPKTEDKSLFEFLLENVIDKR